MWHVAINLTMVARIACPVNKAKLQKVRPVRRGCRQLATVHLAARRASYNVPAMMFLLLGTDTITALINTIIPRVCISIYRNLQTEALNTFLRSPF